MVLILINSHYVLVSVLTHTGTKCDGKSERRTACMSLWPVSSKMDFKYDSEGQGLWTEPNPSSEF